MFAAGDPIHLVFETGLALEGRTGQKIDVQRGEVTRVTDAALTAGPWVLFATGLRSPTNLLLLSDAQGKSRISAEDFAHALVNEIEKPTHIRSQMTVAY